MSATITRAVSSAELEVRADLKHADDRGVIIHGGRLSLRIACGRSNVWLALTHAGEKTGHLRLGPHAGPVSNFQMWSKADGVAGCEFTTPIGLMRVRLTIHGESTLRCSMWFLPDQDTRVTAWPRDFYTPEDVDGDIHTAQRGLRSGIVFASTRGTSRSAIFYFQNFSALNEYFAATGRTPVDSTGGHWPEFGYAPPAGDDCVLPKGRETAVSDAYVSFATGVGESEGALAACYLDQLADVLALIDKPACDYHNWPQRAEDALRDLSLSPLCTYVRQQHRYLMPYVADRTKPPESMVQFTVSVNAGEYDAWRNAKGALSGALRDTATSFFNHDVGSIVRWLPGEQFGAAQADDNMNHTAMDSWYLHHSLFNVFRIAREGDGRAKGLFQKSLPYVIRVARRFNYHWPIFFNLETLDVIRAEAKPGEGGETDVAGLYALVMLHAHEMFGDVDYLNEAERAVAALHGLGFNLAYQLNTTGFAAEAALRLWKITKERSYLDLSTVCLANLFDNMWLWQADYGHARHYRTFFGLFPLRDAPYIAPYEELEAHAKFHEYLSLGGDDVRPAVKYLLAEFQKYALDRCWYYYPDALPADVIAEKTRNGQVERALSVPLEDLQDGRESSGQVGQELYGAGLPFVMTARHYIRLEPATLTAFCDYPMYDFAPSAGGGSWRAGGDGRGSCDLRIVPSDVATSGYSVTVSVQAGRVTVPVQGRISPEGHALFRVRGGQTLEIRSTALPQTLENGIKIGSLATESES